MRASYYDPTSDKVVEVTECLQCDVPGLVAEVLKLQTLRGNPTLEFKREDGAYLSLSTDGELAYLVWVNQLGESFHSVGSGRPEGESLIFDYFGSWSEALPGNLVSMEEAMHSVDNFFLTGTADTKSVLFEPDLLDSDPTY
jgi:hypothetical protein